MTSRSAVDAARRCFQVAGILLLLFTAAAHAQIQDSGHDFSSELWSGEQICAPCHTPHHANQDVDTAHLWNHELSGVNQYTLYDSSTLDINVEQPGSVSKLCLSCHDGTVALDAFGGRNGSEPPLSGPKAVGRSADLSDDHPVGFVWDHQAVVDGGCTLSCHFAGGTDPYTYPVRFYGPAGSRRVECSTCHDPHNNSADDNKMLRLTMNGSALCLLCHNGK